MQVEIYNIILRLIVCKLFSRNQGTKSFHKRAICRLGRKVVGGGGGWRGGVGKAHRSSNRRKETKNVETELKTDAFFECRERERMEMGT